MCPGAELGLFINTLECVLRYDKDVQLFKSKVVDSVKLCNSHLFDQPKIDDPYAIRLLNVPRALHDTDHRALEMHNPVNISVMTIRN